ncbi:PadR family transcriptional regulator [Paramesorhizobium deserti]|uniref:PadR family transcriptional regulator n=1 Tax=Paramesorhizobium deserti TaxID=1494590 RepID=A0A135HX09_9HYPH|nr:PadR family transcriptional regulator [Paramesorhizobium deserti]KXF77732.1 PadR family transcriptional regulator [Paramesorhizobium deserti]
MASPKTNPNFMNGVPELLILKLIAKQEMYGYEVVQAIRLQTEEAILLGEGVIYPVLHALERDGALKSRRQTVNGRRRIYYSITPEGQRRLSDLTSNWARLTKAIQTVIVGGQHAEAV